MRWSHSAGKSLDSGSQKAHTVLMNTATDKQISYYNSLLDQIVRLDDAGEFSAEIVASSREQFPTRTVDNASISINRAMSTLARLKAATPVVKVVVKPAKVPTGHYALVDAEGVVKFYRVGVVTEGKWAGYTFVDAQASDDYYKVGRETSRGILAAIAADPAAAMKLYGHSLGRCGHCNRTLTDETSRANGIGPICNRKMGW